MWRHPGRDDRVRCDLFNDNGIADVGNASVSDTNPVIEPERGPDPLTTALGSIDPDRLTPREALDKLYELKRLAQSSDGAS